MKHNFFTLPFGRVGRNEGFGLEVPEAASDNAADALRRARVLVLMWMHLMDARPDVAFCRRRGYELLDFTIFDVAPDGHTAFVELEFVSRRWDPARPQRYKAHFVLMADPNDNRRLPRVVTAPWTLDDVRQMTRLGELVVERRSEIEGQVK